MKNLLLFPLMVFATLGCRDLESQPRRLPDIVIVLTDDLGYGDVSIFNPDSKIPTPNMDALAREGVWCTDAHSPASICSPSRYSLLTGRYAWRNPSLRKGVLMPWDPPEVGREVVTLPSILKKVGYATACIGKWHLGFDWPWAEGFSRDKARKGGNSIATVDMFDWSKPITGGPLAVGFDHYFGDDVPNFPPYAFIEDSLLTCEPVNIDRKKLNAIGFRGAIHGDGPGQEDWELDNVLPVITRKAVHYIEEKSRGEVPFFLYFTTTSPHTPVVPRPEFQGKSGAGYYGDYVMQTDEAIGQVIQALKKNNRFENTLIIVTSDNGPSDLVLSIVRDYGHFPAGNLRGMKRDSWEGGHRVPFIVSWPVGEIAGGKENGSLISLIDLLTTIAGIVGYDLPENSAEDSYDILPSLRDNQSVRRELVYQNSEGDLGLRQDHWVYLEGSGGSKKPDWLNDLLNIQSPDTAVQLFDLRVDAGQKSNVQDIHPDVVRAMAKRLSDIQATTKMTSEETGKGTRRAGHRK